jgi:hypothetical protein
MAIANSAWFTLTDIYKVLGPDLGLQAVAMVLAKSNPVLQDMSWVEANGIAYHQTTQQTSLPGNTWAKLNEAVVPTKGLTQQVTDVCARLAGFCAVDKELLRLNGLDGAFRAIQDTMRLESMSQDHAYGVFYANTNQNPERFMGLGTRYSDPANASYGGDQMINGDAEDGDAADDQTSVFFVDWAEDAVTGIYPKGTMAGFDHEDHGTQVLGDETNGFRVVELSEYNWRFGVAVVDPRYCARLCNIDVSKMQAGTDFGLINRMIELEEALPEASRGNRVMYLNKLTRTYLRQLAKEKANVNLTWDTYMGQRIETWNGIPLRRVDAISIAESVITGF